MIGSGAINNNPTFNWIKTLERGTIFAYSANGTLPEQALICNGAEISRTTYKLLFDIIGTTYGEGDGTTTFNLPDLSNARMVTSATVSVSGNGNILGINTPSGDYSLNIYDVNSNSRIMGVASTNGLGQPVGTSVSAVNVTRYQGAGISTDPTISGLTGSINLATTTRYYIKY